MGKPCFLWPSFIHILFIFFFLYATDTVYGQYCREDQSSALLHLQQTLNFFPFQSSKLISWNNGTNCCSWRGVTCNKNGNIIGLDLNGEGIYGGLDNSSSLFDLQHLKNLSLAVNNFSAPIPTSISRLVNLEHLDLSNSGFIGQIPVEISHMTKLLTLDLSSSEDNLLELQRPNLTTLVRNLSQLQVLRLDNINISYQGREWSNLLSSSLPNLRILSLSNCKLFGPPDDSLLRLKYLSEITLTRNTFDAPFPEFFLHFPNLKALIFSVCEIQGKLPDKLFYIQSLVQLDVSVNPLQGTLPGFPQNMSLQTLVLSGTNMSGDLPYTIGNLHKLSVLDLSMCNLRGAIPFSIEKLKQLKYLDLSYNSLAGTLPPSLFALPFLQILMLSFNQFSGLVHEFPNASSSPLATILLNSNRLEGPIPLSIYKLQNLSALDLSFNNFNGTVEVTNLQRLTKLTLLDLSYNSLSFPPSPSTNNFTLLPLSINYLKLAFCNLTVFPNLRNHKSMYSLDLSNNRIQGEIPNWIWNVEYLNLSKNQLSTFEMPFPDPNLYNISTIDLHSNMLTGLIPLLPSSPSFIDYSYNNFNSTIPADIGDYLSNTKLFSVSHNDLVGGLPLSICNGSILTVLDLSYNNLDGEIPSCLFNMSAYLGVLNLSGNKLKGYIPESFSSVCSLKILDLNNNLFEGQVPSSLMICTGLVVLKLGRNQLNDKFPCWLTSFYNLRVLDLRSNKFHGPITSCLNSTNMWSSLLILDLADNNFSGDLPFEYVSSWKEMLRVSGHEEEIRSALLFFKLHVLKNFFMLESYFLKKLNRLRSNDFFIPNSYYTDKVDVIIKGNQLELVKILTTFTLIDLSNNMFRGVIPSEIGQLTALVFLNISKNALTGEIPSSIGNLKNLNSMDLSQNKLTGYIPKELGGLTFLSVLNLSFNDLKGAIPSGPQLQTFTEESYKGNKDLCGFPLNVRCRRDDEFSVSGSPDDSDVKIIEWGDVLVSVEVGFFVGLGITLLPLLVWRRWWNYFSWQIEKFLIKIFGIRRHR